MASGAATVKITAVPSLTRFGFLQFDSCCKQAWVLKKEPKQ